MLSGQRRVCVSVPGAAITFDLRMNQYSKDTREAGPDNNRERCFFPGKAKQRYSLLTDVMCEPVYKVATPPRGSSTSREMKDRDSQRGTRRERQRLGRRYSGAKVRKTQCVFGVNEAVRQDRGGNRRQDSVEL